MLRSEARKGVACLPPGAAVYPVGDVGVAVVHPLVDLVGRVAPVDEGYQGGDQHHRYEQQPDQDETQDKGHGPAHHEDEEPGYLVPERLQGVEAHARGPVFVDQPDDEGSERHEPHEPGQHAQVRQHGPGALVLGTHRVPRRSLTGGTTRRVTWLWRPAVVLFLLHRSLLPSWSFTARLRHLSCL